MIRRWGFGDRFTINGEGRMDWGIGGLGNKCECDAGAGAGVWLIPPLD